MELVKVQSEGGLNVTLTIRLLMHGKVCPQNNICHYPLFENGHYWTLNLFVSVPAGGGEHHWKGIYHKHNQNNCHSKTSPAGILKKNKKTTPILFVFVPERRDGEENA